MAELIFDVPLQERLTVIAGARCCFLANIQGSPRGTLFPCVALLLICYWLCVQAHLYESLPSVLLYTPIMRKCLISFALGRWFFYGECWEKHYNRMSHLHRWKSVFSHHLPSLGLFLKHICNNSKMKKSSEWVFHFLNRTWRVCVHLMKLRWKAQSIPSAHSFIHSHRGSAKQRPRGRGLWNDNTHSSSSRQRHALLLARNVLTNCGRPQRQPPLLLYFFANRLGR